MAHNLTLRADGRTEFASALTKGWHDLGQLHDRLMTEKEALTISLCDWLVKKTPVTYDFFNPVTGEMEQRFVDNKSVVVREDNGLALGVVNDTHMDIQNHELAEFVSEVCGQGKAMWDTMGSLGGGKVVFMQVEVEGHLFLKSRPDDKTVKKILFFSSHDGSKAFTGMITPIRVVCQNTLNAALGKHTNAFKIKHTKNWKNKKEHAAKILGFSDAFFDDLQIVMDVLDSKEVDKTYLRGFTEALFPADEKDIPKQTITRRETVSDLFYNGMGNLGKTRWDLWNAVTEYTDHHANSRIRTSRYEDGKSDEIVERDARFERNMFGSGAALKQQSLNLLLA
jgi:phage/plasmid-like protein (TIGR03299 family)